MRQPERQELNGGAVSYRVRFRASGKQTSETFHGAAAYRDALEFCKLMDAIGPAGAMAYMDAAAKRDSRALTLDQWAPKHIGALTGITEGTRAEYARMYEREWAKSLGPLPLDMIDREAVAHAINELSSRRSDKTVRNYHGLLAAMMESAVLAGHIGASPCKGMRLPRRTSHEATDMRLLSQADFARLLKAVPEHYRPLVLFLAATGARWGEAQALTVGDVDLTHGSVRINKAVKWSRGQAQKRVVGPPKTRRSNRTVTMPAQLVDSLRPVAAAKSRSDLMFLAERGGPLHHSNFYEYIWRPACESTELDPRPRIHDLRHSHASWLIASGVPLPVIQSRLGHESIQTTVDTYGHLAPDLQRAAADAAGVALGAIEG